MKNRWERAGDITKTITIMCGFVFIIVFTLSFFTANKLLNSVQKYRYNKLKR